MQSKKVFYGVLIVVCVLGGIAGNIWYHNYVGSVVDVDVTDVSSNLEQTPQSKSLAELVAPLYPENACLKAYVQHISMNTEFNIAQTCPDLVAKIDIAVAKPTPTGIEQFIVQKQLLSNATPLKNYLIAQKDSRTSNAEYGELYRQYVISQHLASMSEKDSAFALNTILGSDKYDAGNAFDVIIHSDIATSTDAALVQDLYNSGEYNVYSTLYDIRFMSDDIKISKANIVDTSVKGATIHLSLGTDGQTSDDQVVNGSFDQNGNFHEYGFLPFGAYPCNIDHTYSYFGDRWILVSSSQAKDCSKYNITSPDSIPDDFDNTMVQLYSVSPKVLEQAQKLKI